MVDVVIIEIGAFSDTDAYSLIFARLANFDALHNNYAFVAMVTSFRRYSYRKSSSIRLGVIRKIQTEICILRSVENVIIIDFIL